MKPTIIVLLLALGSIASVAFFGTQKTRLEPGTTNTTSPSDTDSAVIAPSSGRRETTTSIADADDSGSALAKHRARRRKAEQQREAGEVLKKNQNDDEGADGTATEGEKSPAAETVQQPEQVVISIIGGDKQQQQQKRNEEQHSKQDQSLLVTAQDDRGAEGPRVEMDLPQRGTVGEGDSPPQLAWIRDYLALRPPTRRHTQDAGGTRSVINSMAKMKLSQAAARRWSEKEEGTSTSRVECSDNSNCTHREGCVQDEEGICYKPPFDIVHPELYRPRRKNQKGTARGGSEKEELQCSWMPPAPSPLPNLRPLRIARQTVEEKAVNIFKHFTGSFFQKWYDWDAPIKQVDPKEGFKMKGRHVGPDEVYVIENFCFDGAGSSSGLTGYRPFMDPFMGGDDVSYFNGFTPVDWYTKRTTPLTTEPTWYIDRKLMLYSFQRDFFNCHPAHAMMRSGALISNIESAWPRDPALHDVTQPRDDVTVAYLSWGDKRDPPGSTSREYCKDQHQGPWKDTNLGRYTTLAAKSHFTAFMTPAGKEANSATRVIGDRWLATEGGKKLHVEDPVLFGQIVQRSSALRGDVHGHPICFKEAVVYQSCFGPTECESALPMIPSKRKEQPKKRSRAEWPLWGYRNPKTQRLIARRFLACANAADDTVLSHSRKTAANPAPTVLFVHRSSGRGYVQSHTLIPKIHKILTATFPAPSKPKLVVMEMNDKSVVELVNLYSRVDIIISTWNSGFMFGFLSGTLYPQVDASDASLPAAAASLGLEIHTSLPGGLHHKPGVNRNLGTDYGSMYRAMNYNSKSVVRRADHVSVPIPVNHYNRHNEHAKVPPLFFDRSLRMGLCLWRENLQIAVGQASGGARPVSLDDRRQRCGEMLVTDINDALQNEGPLPGSVSRDMRYQIRSSVPEWSVDRNPRLVALYNSLLGDQLDHVWHQYSHSRVTTSIAVAHQDPAAISGGHAMVSRRETPRMMLLMKCPALPVSADGEVAGRRWGGRKMQKGRAIAAPTFVQALIRELTVMRVALPRTADILLLFDVECPIPKAAIQREFSIHVKLFSAMGMSAELRFCGNMGQVHPDCLDPSTSDVAENAPPAGAPSRAGTRKVSIVRRPGTTAPPVTDTAPRHQPVLLILADASIWPSYVASKAHRASTSDGDDDGQQQEQQQEQQEEKGRTSRKDDDSPVAIFNYLESYWKQQPDVVPTMLWLGEAGNYSISQLPATGGISKGDRRT